MMNSLQKMSALVCVPFLLSACAANKGDFGLDDVYVKPVEQPKNRFKDEETPPRTEEQVSEFEQPALGVELAVPLRNRHPKNQEKSVNLNPEKIVRLNGGLDIPHEQALKKAAAEEDTFFIHSHDGFKESRKRGNLNYVRSGYVMATTIRERNFNPDNGPLRFAAGPKGYIFYQGVSPSQAFPATGKAVYKGTWDFVTNAVKDRDGGSFTVDNNSHPGDRFGATSIDDPVNDDLAAGTIHQGQPVHVGHSSEFEVDFAGKTLKGALYKNHRIIGSSPQVRTKRYTVDAKLSGNRFRGTASAENKQALHFGKDADLEGGFFGPNAEELAGKFLARDNSLFGVFAGRRQKADGEQVEKNIDAYRTDIDNLTMSVADNFGDARKLVFNGKVFPLLPAHAVPSEKSFTGRLKYDTGNGQSLFIHSCCGNLDYVKFGSYWLGSEDNRHSATLFFQGERTPSGQIPASGQARYQGTWQAQFVSKSGQSWNESPSAGDSGSRAVFDVNFADKRINGTLTADNRTSPTFSISGRIQGNGFSGTASTGKEGFVLDPQSTNPVRVHIGNAKVDGGFYGPKASELGGVFHSNNVGGDRVSGSFGAKKQVPNP